jgi:glycosyltransferase involved in cell wall biosynthesis
MEVRGINRHKIKVLHIIPNFGYGGAEMLVKDMLLAQDSEYFETAACSLYPFTGTTIEQELQKHHIKVFYLTKKLGPDPQMIRGLYDTFRNFKPHVIHTHRYVIRYTLIPSLLCRIPVKIHTIHNVAENEVDWPGRIIHLFAYHFFKYKPIGVSNNISNYASNYYKINNVSHIYNGIRTKLYSLNNNLRVITRKSLDIPEDNIVFISVGRFSAQKNYRLLMESFRKVMKRQSNSTMLMAGDGELRTELENFADEIGLRDKVKFLGLRKDIPALLAASDVFVLSSDWEGLPLVVIEAMAAGKPVVATAVGGVPELVADGVNGILVPPGDATALAHAMLRMASDPVAAQRLGVRGRKIARERFDTTAMARAYENLYRQELPRRDRRHG